MFNDLLLFGKMKRATRLTWLTLPLSLLLHIMVIAGLVVVPLLRADSSLPKVKVITVAITAPPTPLVPAKGSGRKNGGGGKTDGGKGTGVGKAIETKNHSKNPIRTGKFIIPIAVPETIEDENLDNIGIGDGGSGNGDGGSGDGGGGGGIPDGIEDGDTNALIGKDETVLRIANVQMPRKIREVKPFYPPAAVAARVQGKVIIEAMTDMFGRVLSTRIIASANPLLNEEALKAVKQWLYEPYILNGIPKPVLFTVTITFSLTQ
jgi:protein TonB